MPLSARKVRTFEHFDCNPWGIGVGVANVTPLYGVGVANVTPLYGVGVANVTPLYGVGVANVTPLYGVGVANVTPLTYSRWYLNAQPITLNIKLKAYHDCIKVNALQGAYTIQ